MTIGIFNQIKIGLLGWAIFVVHIAQADELPFNHQAQEPHLASPPAILDSQRQQQKILLDDAQQQREDLRKKSIIPEQTMESEQTIDTQCVNINEILFQGAESLSISVQHTVTQPYVHRCVTLTELKQLVRAVTNAYITEGYITSQAYLPEQSLSDGKLRITVIEGRIDAIEIDGKPPRMAKMLFPGIVGKILNLRDIEQGLEHLNRLASSRFTIEIKPGAQPGYSTVHIRQQARRFPGRGLISVDNSGQKGIGEYQASAGLVLDAPLGLGEQWSFSWLQDTDFRPAGHSRSLALSMSVPYGYWTARYHYFYHTSRQKLAIMGKNYPYDSENQTHQLDITRTLYRDGKQKFGLQAGGRYKAVKNAIADQKLFLSSPVIKTASVGAQYSTLLGGGYFTFRPAFEYGNAVTSPPLATRNTFRKFNLSSSYYYPLSPNTAYLTSFYGQLSPDDLPSPERLSLGGLYSVRGYKTQYLSGDQGFYWRQEVTHQFDVGQIGALTFMGALDYGHRVGQPRYGVAKAHLLGGALGVTLTQQVMSSQLMIGKPLYYPHTLKPDAWSFYASVSLEF
ncbi:ShlB/FhaC/HecB family hemolysin secretion/activation protein [Xenorhabdus griffiniae]|uniref:ShlB/FhaC/HecB family hemolysin secretion/activation protein n=1 Tax=Xenorhabdus griffiniae TaxID=351672 RepID=A0ABY9XLK4_9GAMM|nr:ShlB/FhaC/HecB family hemolysin secretion/activation protein [Xenorhabdus griffiniae]MBD1227406.1 ShlB/FhaC/HecB family hemolysin secretion/activation protein [Xenorhabdus griffiniae]MBE8588988.1 ShlB/FhaC/HecB family hemolysin secretion/activation protein [Xenorhabdus griffiniae]WMV73754.1 ShlB/FhaC/HecB family hemolysin secretion/activation protein [Xenorhabdus griffiniae]WNH03435.1 ShlB/FhaC/HecB family hemolysin secretion/activation protein [Xenorhabdus griffiniae]